VRGGRVCLEAGFHVAANGSTGSARGSNQRGGYSTVIVSCMLEWILQVTS
jgi:hypothetical protein